MKFSPAPGSTAATYKGADGRTAKVSRQITASRPDGYAVELRKAGKLIAYRHVPREWVRDTTLPAILGAVKAWVEGGTVLHSGGVYQDGGETL